MLHKLPLYTLLAGLGLTALGLAGRPTAAATTARPFGAAADSLDALKIVYLGSSVPYGQGATNKYGYTSRYTAELQQRHAAGLGRAWTSANASVPGDNTSKVAARWRRDLLPQRGRYVVLALSLGNEGIHGGGQPIFEQFGRNLAALVARARADGRVPVITNCYTRNDFTPEDYAFTKQMNLLLHAWTVPTVNLLGAVDDGQGHWAPGYWDDALHPNDRGHAELARAIVPSLFDALRAGKPVPRWQPSSGTALAPGAALRVVPEAGLHAFTQAVSFWGAGPAGRLLTLTDSLGTGFVDLDAVGTLTYASARGGRLASTGRATGARWHHLVLTHYYARGETVLYLDSTRVGSLPEKLLLRQLTLGGHPARPGGKYRNWLLYRAGMNAEEVHALAADSLLKSSLEVYAPLAGPKAALSNLAQSTNRLQPLPPAAPARRPRASSSPARRPARPAAR
ncbi:SGNH/GDSL hydrolase family protein [Hymenobacter sp. RP-2-7]|uniref:SGNH/GDSL hydrolase family protein n=1 Tax=Hymenobacter polaris TaxID=2682546 RepID=A0A7Y0FMX1_9BACT|nr:SGNH/GDSL hydrolase family protein [Hymenobacter polaris]NML66342.1 SGNH/GDSL hydrolase family protein [Hymenobacter polaris]